MSLSKLARVNLARAIERCEGRNGLGVDSSNYTAVQGYHIYDDKKNRLVIISRNGTHMATPYENVIRMEYANPEDAGIAADGSVLEVAKGDATGEMDISISGAHKGPGRPANKDKYRIPIPVDDR